MNKAEGLPEVGKSSDFRTLAIATVAGGKQEGMLRVGLRIGWDVVVQVCCHAGDGGSPAKSNSCLNAGMKC